MRIPTLTSYQCELLRYLANGLKVRSASMYSAYRSWSAQEALATLGYIGPLKHKELFLQLTLTGWLAVTELRKQWKWEKDNPMDEETHDRILKLHNDLKRKGETIKMLRDKLKLTQASAEAAGTVMLEMQQQCIDQRLRADRLQETLDDWQETHRQIMAEECAGDEIHCTCVPNLRRRIVELEKVNTRLQDSEDELFKKVGEFEQEVHDVYEMRQAQLESELISDLRARIEELTVRLEEREDT